MNTWDTSATSPFPTATPAPGAPGARSRWVSTPAAATWCCRACHERGPGWGNLTVVRSQGAKKMGHLVAHPTARKWVITPVINGTSKVNPLITGVITHLLSGMSHQASPFFCPWRMGIESTNSGEYSWLILFFWWFRTPYSKAVWPFWWGYIIHVHPLFSDTPK